MKGSSLECSAYVPTYTTKDVYSTNKGQKRRIMLMRVAIQSYYTYIVSHDVL